MVFRVRAYSRSSVAGLSEVFPQDAHPFPREVLARRWHEEVDDPALECFVVERAGAVAGFVALDGDELKHFGVALEEWGSGLAFWEKHGWVDTGERSRGPMPPHAELLTYAYDPDPSGTGPTVAT